MNKEKDNLAKFSLSIYGNVTSYNKVISKARCRIFYKYANRNGTYITDEFAEKLISTLSYVPVKGIYDSMKDDYTDHGRERYEGRIYGIVPENPNFAWEKHLDVDGVERVYADVFLFTGLYKQEAFDIINKGQSMELYVDSIEGEWQFIEGKKYFVFTEGCFLGLQALGADYEPCFEGAAFYTFVDSVKNLINDFEEADLFQKQNLGGENHMEFKLSDNQKYNMLWTLLNERFTAEDGYIMDYALCDVYDEYAVAFNFGTNSYERVYYTKTDATDSLTIDKKEVCYIVDVNEEEKRALEVLHTMNNDTYEKVDEMVNGLQEKIQTQETEYSAKIEESNSTIATLQQDKETLESELTEAKQNYEASAEVISTLTAENAELQNFKAQTDLKAKEAIIEKYSSMLDASVIEEFSGKINDYSAKELDKELAYALVQTKSTIFTINDEGGFLPKENEALTGVEATLTKYKNRKK